MEALSFPFRKLPIFLSLSILLLLCNFPSAHCHDFLHCLSSGNHSTVSRVVVYTPSNPSYTPVLNSSLRNFRFTDPSTPKPLFIVTPTHESQIQAVIRCSVKLRLQIRTRSGGHDYEGVSSWATAPQPFIILDLVNMSHISINARKKTAWAQSGATIGQIYYKLSQISRTLAFPAGVCPTVGVGGHFSGGGYGTLLRKFGLAADNIIDARIITVDGKILDRKSMGEDLFWAIRGGGGASFGVITAWKLKLVTVPKIVTVFSVGRTIEENATKIFHKWQSVAPNFPKELLVPVAILQANSTTRPGKKTVMLIFNAVFLGRAANLVKLLSERLPELGLKRSDCREVSWIQSALFMSAYPIETPPAIFESRDPLLKFYFKGKSDYVQEPIPEHGLEGLWKLMLEDEAELAQVIPVPYGGRMAEISESALPFPHRAGNLYKFQHIVFWNEPGEEASKRHIDWMRRLYEYLTPYVSKSPRAGYINYRDLDLGVNDVQGNTSYAKASVWGLKYFNKNFRKLVEVKTRVDPTDFFRNEQSIPPFLSVKAAN
ncbi:tetrahydroberberine oxidase-like [Andrographis paniculata]|uniref:tetrahydroberberine oxidase-like n=1 Tax=Andrographis paniculata TaxID=175694 RepID=UPI0021E9A61B|nr:tetrahydroberberine oxidase-like [Andrographis paniculata]